MDSRLYISDHKQQTLFFNTCIHGAKQQAAVRMLIHSSQLKSLLSGSKLPDSDLLLTSNPNPDKPLTTTSQSTFLRSSILQNQASVAFISFYFDKFTGLTKQKSVLKLIKVSLVKLVLIPELALTV